MTVLSEKIHSRRNWELLRRTTEGLDCRVLVNNLLYPDFRATFVDVVAWPLALFRACNERN